MKNDNHLLDITREHDACGIGAVVHIDGRQDYQVVDQALTIVEKLEHRAGKDATKEVGDGVGILLQISERFFSKVAKKQGIEFHKGDCAIGMFFLPQDVLLKKQAQKVFQNIVKKEGAIFLGWRDVPCQEDILGQKAKDCMPSIMQCFIQKSQDTKSGLEFEKGLYRIRRIFEKSCPQSYVVSLSSKTIVYKGMFLVQQLRLFYLDLQDRDYQSAIALVHSRFSTNTNPSWQRAHPNRMIAHNGEINTIRGNVNRMLAREETLTSSQQKRDLEPIFPIINSQGSDSAILDNSLEFLYMNNIPIEKAIMMMIPEPWKNIAMPQVKKDFYHYYATMMEPWDGPAAILFSDGDKMGAVLDRNGLRPARYYIMDDQTLILSSEVGVLDIDEKHVIKKERLEPGKMLLVDTMQQQLIDDEQCKMKYATCHPYGEWLDYHLLHLKDLPASSHKPHIHTQKQRDILYKVFGYTYEDIKEIILPMAQNKNEAIASMGTDIPLAVLSQKHYSLFHYFKQQFAQVTNPPIDSLREDIVVDTTIYLGGQGYLLNDQPQNCQVLEINNPILDSHDMDKIKRLNQPHFKSQVISLLFYKGTSLKEALDQLFLKCDKAYREGANILILSDRGVDENHLIIPSLLAVSALENHLVKTKKKTAVSIVLESGEPRDVHQFACLLGYGASAIYPYLAHECIKEMIDLDMLDKQENQAIADYNNAILKGIVKIAAKMGISTLQSYQSAQIFETIGLSDEIIQKYFPHTMYKVGGIGLKEIEDDILYHHNHAFDLLGLKVDTSLDSIGFHKLRRGPYKEQHLYSPETIVMLQTATQTNDYELYKEYSKQLTKQPFSLRHLFEFDSSRPAISLEEVESVESIVQRFKTGAMSYGSISKEAHECLAIAMNQLKGKSNSGEGGEERLRLYSKANSAIKQVASGRFGVTSEYLVSAKEIQIKMAQGAKPGEGGHLPGKKVYPWIGKTRYSTPGVTLISPPPHHDIYSIEDLAQLIYDLKNANHHARISVKLVAESGVGTIASGVAKAGAEVILISGYDGGTGAAPQSSIHHAGLPWELGLIEAHQSLIDNGLRTRVILETDGKLMSGKDVAIAAMLGAEEFGFATAPLVTMGCVMMRVCNQDTCPVGIATQNKNLRKRFQGKPEYVINFMRFVASELREIMADLGFKTVDEMIGRVSCLKVKSSLNPRHQLINLSKLLPKEDLHVYHHDNEHYDFELEKTVDQSQLLPKFKQYLDSQQPHFETIKISSTDRSVGTMLGSVVTRMYQNHLSDDMYQVHCIGGAGVSFGAFLPKGITMQVEGDANDYFGKGLSGGKLMIYPSRKSKIIAKDNVIIGNVALYGATSGEAYICGKAGERFAVRNSGAIAVVEGCGDHGLEYMTGGKVLVLGKTGKNFAAGMSGGIAYVFDQDHSLYLCLNKEMVKMEDVHQSSDFCDIQDLLKRHIEATDSTFAKDIMNHFDDMKKHFKKIIPCDYERILENVDNFMKQGYSYEKASLLAFEATHKE